MELLERRYKDEGWKTALSKGEERQVRSRRKDLVKEGLQSMKTSVKGS
jgi:hypothetical protein